MVTKYHATFKLVTFVIKKMASLDRNAIAYLVSKGQER